MKTYLMKLLFIEHKSNGREIVIRIPRAWWRAISYLFPR